MRRSISKLFLEFFKSEQFSGIVLIICTVTSLLLANSIFGKQYSEFWHTQIGLDFGWLSIKYSIDHWVNDGLMAIFFLLIGLEIERELYIGELSDIKNAALPIFAAVGGMITPALIHFLINRGTETQAGFGIPMATDIAFALGILALLGKRVPLALKVFLTALAITDDLGAILVIALFYVGDFSLGFFLAAIAVFAGLLILNRLGIRKLSYYLIPGVIMWYFMLRSGVHATISGVLLAFAIPFVRGKEISPSYQLQHFLHKPVALFIMPLFALANTGIVLSSNWVSGLISLNSIGIFAGLVLGKPLGILSFSYLSTKLGLARLPRSVNWKQITGAGLLGGIGFTMSILITILAFSDPVLIEGSKIAVLFSSLIAGIAGFVVLKWVTRRKEHKRYSEPDAKLVDD